MKMTGLQQEPFDVNLYVFYRAWLNDGLNKFGYVKRGFSRKYRDWNGPRDQPNAGKLWSQPKADPFLNDAADRIPTVAKLFAELHPDERFYLTNIQASRLEPATIKDWPNDLWVFPYYRDPQFIPFNAHVEEAQQRVGLMRKISDRFSGGSGTRDGRIWQSVSNSHT